METEKSSGYACEIIVQHCFIRVATLAVTVKAVADGPVGQVLARPLYFSRYIKFHSTKSNK